MVRLQLYGIPGVVLLLSGLQPTNLAEYMHSSHAMVLYAAAAVLLCVDAFQAHSNASPAAKEHVAVQLVDGQCVARHAQQLCSETLTQGSS